MEIVNREVPASQYASYSSDPVFQKLSQAYDQTYLAEQIHLYQSSGQQMGDESE